MARRTTLSRGRNPSTVILGEEPTFDESLQEDDLVWEINKSMNWFRNNFNHSKYKNALKIYMKSEGFSEEDIAKAVSAPKKQYEWEYAGVYSHICNTSSIKLPTVIQNSLDSSIKSLIDNASEKVTKATTVNVQENIKNKVSEIIADLELHIDDAIEIFLDRKKGKLIDVPEWIKENEIKGIHASRMVEFFQQREEELSLALSGKDPDLSEGYSHFKKTSLRKYRDFISDIVGFLNEQSKIAKTQRKPRAKKQKTPLQLVSKLKYMKEHEGLKLKSVDPKKIINSSRVILYNPQKRILFFYESSELSDGLSVKNCKIINFDEKRSSRKTIRDPKIIMNGGKFTAGLRASASAYKDIKSKEYPVTGRVNEECIILQVLNR